MAQLVVIQRKCTGCGVCVSACPFGAIDLKDTAEINAACRMCGLCEKSCPEKAIMRLETKAKSVDKEAWRDILVFCEMTEEGLHPVGPELIGKARELAPSAGYQVDALLLGRRCDKAAEALRHYGVRNIYVYDDEALGFFRAEMYAACAEDIIRKKKPSVVLVGATVAGAGVAALAIAFCLWRAGLALGERIDPARPTRRRSHHARCAQHPHRERTARRLRVRRYARDGPRSVRQARAAGGGR